MRSTMRRRTVLVVLWLIGNVFVFWAIALTASGYSLEGYLPWESSKVFTYSPVLYSEPGDEPTEILYMVGHSGGLYYYLVWRDEYFGNALLDKLYRVMRGLIYGTSEDVEVFKVVPENGSFYFQTYGHSPVHGEMLPDGSCLWLERGLSVPNCTVNGTHVKLYVVTWNHMLSLLPDNNTVQVFPEMRHMIPEDYVALGMVKRTKYSIAGIAFDSLTASLAVTVLLNFILFVLLRRRFLLRGGRKNIRGRLLFKREV